MAAERAYGENDGQGDRKKWSFQSFSPFIRHTPSSPSVRVYFRPQFLVSETFWGRNDKKSKRPDIIFTFSVHGYTIDISVKMSKFLLQRNNG